METRSRRDLPSVTVIVEGRSPQQHCLRLVTSCNYLKSFNGSFHQSPSVIKGLGAMVAYLDFASGNASAPSGVSRNPARKQKASHLNDQVLADGGAITRKTSSSESARKERAGPPDLFYIETLMGCKQKHQPTRTPTVPHPNRDLIE